MVLIFTPDFSGKIHYLVREKTKDFNILPLLYKVSGNYCVRKRRFLHTLHLYKQNENTKKVKKMKTFYFLQLQT